MDKIVSVVHGNCDFDPIRFRAKIAIFDFDSIIVTSLIETALNHRNHRLVLEIFYVLSK